MKTWKRKKLITTIGVFAFFALLWQPAVAFLELGLRTRLNSKLGKAVNISKAFRGLHDRFPTNLNDIANLEDGAAHEWASRELINEHGDRYEFLLSTNFIEVRVIAKPVFPIGEVFVTQRMEFSK